MVLNGALIAGGVVLAAGGLYAAHRLKGTPGVFAALVVVAGVLLALSGTLLVAVPDFFKG